MKYLFIFTFMILCSCGSSKEEKPSEGQNSEDLVSQGPAGKAGPTGQTGSVGGVILYDALDRAVGVKFNEETGAVAHVILLDHVHAKIDRYSGALKAPHDQISCMYQTGDCSGTCYVYDRRWLDFVVSDAQGKTWVASRQTTDTGPLDMDSYVDGNGVCQAAAISTIESFATKAYVPSGFTLPLAAPLYWDIAK